MVSIDWTKKDDGMCLVSRVDILQREECLSKLVFQLGQL